MGSIPTANVAAVLHLAFVSALIGVIAAETVMEALPLRQRDLHQGAVRFHLWIGLLLEVPIAMGVVVTGIAMATLVDSFSLFHVVKISLASIALLLGLTCVFRVIRRYRLWDDGAMDDVLEKDTRKIHLTAAFIYALMIGPAILGVWLAYKRVAEFYG